MKGPMIHSTYRAYGRAHHCAVGIVAALALLTTMLAGPAQASYGDEAQFDATVIQLINAHRAGLGIDVLAHWQPLSVYARTHSEHMANGSTACASAGTNFGHSNLSLTHPLNPPGTVLIAENINYNCAPIGMFAVTWSTAAGPLPSYCTNPIDYTTPEKTVCDWLQSPSHRSTIENPALTHFGTGTDTVVLPNGILERFSTATFTGSDLPPHDVSCDGVLDIGDALSIAQYDTGTRVNVGSCALTNPATQINASVADVNGDGDVSTLDALLIAQCSIGMIACPS